MFVSFDELPDTAKVWVYQTETKLSDSQKGTIVQHLSYFIESWQSHGHDLKGSGKIEYDHFLILAIDEDYTEASGCSIDKSVHFIQQLQNELGLNFLDRSKQAYITDAGVAFFPISEAKNLVNSGQLSESTLTFNNSITSKGQLQMMWQLPAGKNWMGRFFKSNNEVVLKSL